MHDFEDIRPYNDSEVRPVIDSLLSDLEVPGALARFRFPRLYALFPTLTSRVVQFFLRREFAHVDSVRSMQDTIEKYLDALIERTTDGLTHSGLGELAKEDGYLFISNHRDITMDPALVNYMLYHEGFDTLQVAIGDNLLKRPYLTHLMKLNKSFIVKRSVQGREKLKASRQLSAYIHHCIDTRQNVWIAQREGRAKNGIDKSEAAIITMLHMADRSKENERPLWESINALKIVPVSISYEFDPCDHSKAEELHAIDTQGRYEKTDDTDVQSILQGIMGDKGAVHVGFGSPILLSGSITAEGVAQMLDEQIIRNYRLTLVNYLALEMTQKDFMDFSELPGMFKVTQEDVDNKRDKLQARLQAAAPELRPYMLSMYANPVLRKHEAGFI